jgi:hypothetical protein
MRLLVEWQEGILIYYDNSMEALQKLKIELQYDPTLPFIGYLLY